MSEVFTESKIILFRDDAKTALLKIKTVEDALTHLNKLKTFEVWVRAEKKDSELQNIIAEQKLRTQRILGQLLKQTEKQNGARGIGKKVESNSPSPLLKDSGLTYDQSSTFQQIASIPEEKFEEFIAEKKEASEITTAGMLRVAKGAHVTNNSGDIEWYTPEKYIDSAKKVMGQIDLDPASSKQANEIIKASKFYDETSNGLLQKWFGCIWMNPPYAKGLVNDFIGKLEAESFEQAIILVNNATETKWGQKLLRLSNVVCFHTGRISFIDPDGVPADAPLQGQMIVYIGSKCKKFADEFSQYGLCMSIVK